VIVRAKAPLRLGLAGGGTDVSPYSDTYGGCVLNASIDMHAYTTIEPLPHAGLEFVAKDLKQSFSAPTGAAVALDGELMLHKAVHARVVRDFMGGRRSLPVRVTT
jgi:D-glycero-alpha-D-manno-heptose-7-phosphate kinase